MKQGTWFWMNEFIEKGVSRENGNVSTAKCRHQQCDKTIVFYKRPRTLMLFYISFDTIFIDS